MKEQLEDYQEEKFRELLASDLGISVDELDELQWEIDPNRGNDDMIFGYTIQFSENSPKHILNKIDGLSKDNCVTLDMNIFQ